MTRNFDVFLIIFSDENFLSFDYFLDNNNIILNLSNSLFNFSTVEKNFTRFCEGLALFRKYENLVKKVFSLSDKILS